MKKKLISILMIAILLGIHVCSFAATASDLNNVKNQKEEAEEELDNVKTEMSSTMQQVQKLSESIGENEAKLEEINAKMTTLQNEMDQTKEELEKAEENYAKQKDTLEERLIAQYKAGTTSYLDVLLNSTSFSNFISNYYLVGRIAKYDTQLLEEIEKEKEKIEEAKKQLEVKESEYKVEKANQEKTNVLLKNAKAQKDTYIAKLSEDEKSLQQKIDEYQREMDAIEAEIARAAASASQGGGGHVYTGGTLQWPCPNYTRISSRFGNRASPGGGVGSRNHKGLDLAAPHGVPILSSGAGVVLKVSNTCSHDYAKTPATKCSCGGGYGNYVMVDHQNGMVTLYAHCSSISVSVGQTVASGQQIAAVGCTGYSTGNHLHFGTLLNGTYVNPEPYLGM